MQVSQIVVMYMCSLEKVMAKAHGQVDVPGVDAKMKHS